MNKIYENIFLYSIYFSYILYFFILFGIGNTAPEYLNILKEFIKFYVGIILFIRYNPFTYKEKKFNEFDRKLVFSSAVFLLLSIAIIGAFEKYLKDNVINFIKVSQFYF